MSFLEKPKPLQTKQCPQCPVLPSLFVAVIFDNSSCGTLSCPAQLSSNNVFPSKKCQFETSHLPLVFCDLIQLSILSLIVPPVCFKISSLLGFFVFNFT